MTSGRSERTTLRVGVTLFALSVGACEASDGTRHYESACAYYDYGSTCSVPCDTSPDVPITLGITWSDPYCCSWSGQESFSDCRCENHVVVCGAVGSRQLPWTGCEFCPGTPSGRVYEVDADVRPIRDAGRDVIEPLDATGRFDDADMANDADVVDAAPP